MAEDDFLLSVVTEPNGNIVYIHADDAGLEKLEKAIHNLRLSLAEGECDHDHLFTENWGGNDLTMSMLDSERKEDCRQVDHMQIYAWTNEWKTKHNL